MCFELSGVPTSRTIGHVGFAHLDRLPCLAQGVI